MEDTSYIITTELIPRFLLDTPHTHFPSFVRWRFMGAQLKEFTVKTVPYRVRKIVKKVTVTLWMERVWAVMTDTKDRSVKINVTLKPMVQSVKEFVETVEMESPCPNGKYGNNCQKQCNVNCGVTARCDRITGQCEGGCQTGWKGSTCDEHCNGGRFGLNCSHSCGHCLDNKQCHYINGSCSIGCDSGYKGIGCKEVCNNNTYGPKCSMKCGNCLYLYGEQCHYVSGQCPRGCDDGFQGDRCEQALESAFLNSMSSNNVSILLYVCLAVLILSCFLNCFFVFKQVKRKMCRKKTKSENVDEHPDTFNKDEAQTKPSVKYLYERSKNNEYQELYEMPQKSFYDKFQ